MIKAGFARVDITPPLGNLMSGYFYERRADGVLDPLQANALAFGNGTDAAVIVACDVAGIAQCYTDELRALIAEKTQIPASNVMICALHQHTAVSMTPKGVSWAIEDDVYWRMCYRKLVDVAVMAVADMSAARVFTATQKTDTEIAFVRRYWMPDGTVATNPSTRGPSAVRRCDESDNTVRMIRFAREGKKDIAYVNFSTHPDVISGCKFSADWLGFTRRFVEGDNPDVHCIAITGFQGDSNHLDFLKPKEVRPTRENGYAHSRLMGRVIADTVKAIWDKGEEHIADKISGNTQIVYNKTNTEGEEDYAAQKAFYDDYEAGKFDPPPHITKLAYASRILKLRTAPMYQPVVVTALGLGDIAFVGIGGEPFTQYTYTINEMAKGKTVFCSSNTNGYAGYFPHARAFKEGGYEASSSLFTPELEGQLLGAVVELFEKF